MIIHNFCDFYYSTLYYIYLIIKHIRLKKELIIDMNPVSMSNFWGSVQFSSL